ncbi:SRPBCC domain-containing protein [Myxococcus sp. K15C18031901]|uniref:SRPBCC domain-containing protein n=1 Tax=Myxococcus dinghuensis TaxID=2906761 RepID=UPI0020A71054|nr:SRPBCC domain-containing protein [Myxococcus dinghuensis]MCP3099214.1 SRPBCC domain-containing protein [Myxococcus dinghuensis]
MYSLRTEAWVDAPPEAVWRVLTDFATYPVWNPLLAEVAGVLRVGARLAIKVRAPGGQGRVVGITGRVDRLEPSREVSWTGGVRGLLHGRHYWTLAPEGAGTRLVHGEDFTGVLVWGAKRMLVGLRPAYEAMNQALVERVRAGA